MVHPRKKCWICFRHFVPKAPAERSCPECKPFYNKAWREYNIQRVAWHDHTRWLAHKEIIHRYPDEFLEIKLKFVESGLSRKTSGDRAKHVLRRNHQSEYNELLEKFRESVDTPEGIE